VRADLIDNVTLDLTETIFTTLIDKEAKSLNIDQQALLAREVTDKLKQFTDDERIQLATALKDRLFAKYKVKVLLTVPPPIVQKISVDDDPARGPVNAPVTVVMFADFQCPACGRTHPVLDKVLAEFSGKVRFVARDFPLETLHENAFHAALAAGAANAQGKFFEYGDLLYNNQSALDDASLEKYAAQVGLNVSKFKLDFASEKTAAEVRKDIADGESYGVAGTPTIFVNGVMVRGLTAEDFRAAIRNALKTAPAAAAQPGARRN
jgi:protein-disulfide isomerase